MSLSISGHTVRLLIGGISTAFTDESMSGISESGGGTSTTIFQIDDDTKRVFDKNILPIVSVDGTALNTIADPLGSGSLSEINSFIGTVTFPSSQTGTVTITGASIPLTNVLGANSVSMNSSVDVETITNFDNDGYNSKAYNGIKNVTMDIGGFYTINSRFINDINSYNEVLLIGRVTGKVFAGWFLTGSAGVDVVVNGQLREDVTFELSRSRFNLDNIKDRFYFES